MPISVTMPIIVSILTSMSKINTSKSLKARISYFLLAVKSSFSVELSMNKFYNCVLIMLNNACFTPFSNLCQFKMPDSIYWHVFFTNKESGTGVDLDQLVL